MGFLLLLEFLPHPEIYNNWCGYVYKTLLVAIALGQIGTRAFKGGNDFYAFELNSSLLLMSCVWFCSLYPNHPFDIFIFTV